MFMPGEAEIQDPKYDDFLPCLTSSPVNPQIVILSSDDEKTNEMKDTPIVVSSTSSEDELLIGDRFTSQKIEMHNGKIPIYSKNAKSLTSKEIVQLCLGEVGDDYICKSKPISVRYNAVFVVDLHSVDHRSLYADDNGVWQTSSPKTHLRVSFNNGKVENVEVGNQMNFTHSLKRQYGKHKATYIEKALTFQRIISTVYPKTGRCRYAVVQYIHRDGEENDIVMKPHGNARNLKRPFFKTDPEVLEDIKEESGLTKPKRFFKSLMDKAGGALTSTSAASEPRNLRQIYNIRSSQKQRPDEFAHLVSQVKEDSFVRELTIDSDFIQYILTTDKQIVDLKEFCTNPIKFSVFSIDSTFDVGNYYITNTCYENLRILHASDKYRGKYPLEMGPTFVHTKRDTNNYVSFFSSLQRIDNELKDIQAVGTDGDEALMNAVTICFQDAQKLLCADHKKTNIESKLNDLRAAECAKKHVLADIFGKNISSTYEKGLIDSETCMAFDRRLRDLKSTWDCLVPGFHTWFVSYEADLFKSHLIKEVTDLANVYKHFSNNRVESQNDNAKDWVGRAGNVSFPKLNQKMKELVTAQQQDIEMAVFGGGSYELSDYFKKFSQERHIWNGMSAEQRNSILTKFWSSKIGEKITLPNITKMKENVDIIRPISNKQPLETGTPIKKSQKLSIPLTSLNLVGISEEFLQETWDKADELLLKTGSVVEAPGFDGLFVQHSKDITSTRPHLVTSTTAGKVSCNDCPVYQTMKICCHSLVAAQKLGILQKFLKWRQKQKSDVNLGTLVMTGIQSGHKSKVAKPRKGGRTPLDKGEISNQVEREPLIKDITVQGALDMIENIDESHSFEAIYLFQTKATLCYGCRQKFNRETEQNNLVIRHYCEREYSVQGAKKAKGQFAYFHLKSSCVRMKFADFKKENIKISADSEDIVPQEVKDKLKGIGVQL